MLSSDQISALDDRLAPYGSEVVSLYLDVNPASQDNARKAWALRARAAMEELDLPNGAARRISERLRSAPGAPDAKTLAVFAHATDDEPFEVVEIERAMAAVGAHDGALARVGKPFLAPLKLTLLRRRPSLVLQLGGDRIRRFVMEPGDIVELPPAEQDWDETFWRESAKGESGSPTVLPSGGSSHDKYDERTENWYAKLRKRVASELVQTMAKHQAARLILVGTEPELAAFESEMDGPAKELITARLPPPSNPSASAGAMREHAKSAVEEAERAEGEARLDEAVEKGVLGLNLTLAAVNDARVYLLILPDVPYVDVWRCSSSGHVFGNRESAEARCAGGAVERVALADVLPDLAEATGMELAFLSGEADRRLREEHGGLAGLVRW